MFGLGTMELVLILVIVVIIFGVGKLPDIGAGMGRAIKNFKKATSDSEIGVTQEEEKKRLGTSNDSQKQKV